MFGGIAVHNERLLVEHDSEHRFCFVPGGRVEYGENAMQALAREVREELGEDATIGRLALVTDNLFELDGTPVPGDGTLLPYRVRTRGNGPRKGWLF